MSIPVDAFPPGFAEWLQPFYEGRQRLLARLSPEERAICRSVVTSFFEAGRGPTYREVAAASGIDLKTCERLLGELDARDFLVCEDERVLALYPFSDRPGPHQVEVGGKRLYAMWAGGAIAIPIVHGEGYEARVFSQCAQCGASIRFDMTVRGDGAESADSSAMALREWDPVATASDRKAPHMLDGM